MLPGGAAGFPWARQEPEITPTFLPQIRGIMGRRWRRPLMGWQRVFGVNRDCCEAGNMARSDGRNFAALPGGLLR